MGFLTTVFMLPVDASTQGYKLPKLYLAFLVALIAAYLGAIFKMDSIACENVTTCYNYSKLEWSFSQSNVEEALAAWDLKARAAMAFSAGLHIFSSFLFAQLFIFGGMAAAEMYTQASWTRTAAFATRLPIMGRVFNILYCAAHSTIGSMVVGGAPSKSAPVGVGIVLIFALILLVVCALFLIASLVVGLVLWRKSKATRPTDNGDQMHPSKITTV